MIRLRLYRAIDDPESCQKFIVGHRHVLENIGVTKVTSSKDAWMYNPGVYVLIVEDTDDGRVLGGARVHVASKEYPLPVEEATSFIDPKVVDVIGGHIPAGTGEICGLWNSREVAGMGIGAVFLTRAAVAISAQIGLKSLFALCAPYTVKLAENVGYEIETSVGNQGTFYYPKLDLVATFMILRDVDVLSKAIAEERDPIMELRENPVMERTEIYRRREVKLFYQLKLDPTTA
ncbi:MAG TPA: hypothetical protein PL009_10650 [Flavipsychrobacter sp.]|nr:hypothetical protein [Flavipsychrobacter sp.]